MDKTDFGDRMKFYEGKETKRQLIPMLPICVRLDGNKFSKFTKGLRRPYDERLSKLFVETTKYLVELSGAKIGFTESDEISLILNSDSFKSQTFLNGKIHKLNSILSSNATAFFNANIHKYIPNWSNMATFDCRVWNVPNKIEAVNAILWREQDASKNSISMAASHYYSHKELQHKNSSEKQDMLMAKGINWNDYPSFFKRGVFVQSKTIEKKYTTDELDKLPLKHNARMNPNEVYTRNVMTEIDMPIFSTVVNRVGVVFDKEKPKIIQGK